MTDKMRAGFYATADFWREQAEGKLVDAKRKWDRCSELEGMIGFCAFCEFFKEDCDICPLQYCFTHDYKVVILNGFLEWYRVENNTDKSRITGAKQLWSLIEKWMRENMPEYFKRETI